MTDENLEDASLYLHTEDGREIRLDTDGHRNPTLLRKYLDENGLWDDLFPARVRSSPHEPDKVEVRLDVARGAADVLKEIGEWPWERDLDGLGARAEGFARILTGLCGDDWDRVGVDRLLGGD